MHWSHASAQGQRVSASGLIEAYRRVRSRSVALADPLTPEDMSVQYAVFASPTKWHLAHTTWFFETFVLERFDPRFARYDERFHVLFNSYYRKIGERHPRAARGLLTRPGVGEVMAYRDTIDDRVCALLGSLDEAALAEAGALVVLGLHHECQHQELLLTDIKVLFNANPVEPAYLDDPLPGDGPADAGGQGWVRYDGGVVEIGWGGGGFAYDNEGPRHRRFVEPYELAARPVTNAEYAAFVEDGGYRRSGLWLDMGWSAVEQGGWDAPLYWRGGADDRREFTLRGVRGLDPEAPVTGLSYFEADAFARWAGARLPTEAEWEHAAGDAEPDANLLESGRLHPARVRGDAGDGPAGMFGDNWEWTSSSHGPYPGYAPPEGAVGEYNGKFMCNQYVLRGGSCATSAWHLRPTYRNFFEPDGRWQFAGVRLARSVA